MNATADVFQTAFDNIWSPGTVIAALVTGFLLGFLFLGYLAAAPTYASVRLTAAKTALFTVASTLLTGIVFWGGQTFAAWLEGDPGWPRVMTRYVLWVIWALAMGVGTWLRLSIHDHRKARQARKAAETKVATDEEHSPRGRAKV